MNDFHNCMFLCLNSKSKNLFTGLGIKCNYYDITNKFNVPRDVTNNHREFNGFAHLCMICDFYYNSSNTYGIFCENDTLIHKDIQTTLPKILLDFNILQLDILVLGYATPVVVDESMEKYGFSFKREITTETKYTYHNYPDNLKGTQMYILSRKYAKYILDKYYEGYINDTFIDNTGQPFTGTEFIITHNGNRALISPTIACVNAGMNTGINTDFV